MEGSPKEEEQGVAGESGSPPGYSSPPQSREDRCLRAPFISSAAFVPYIPPPYFVLRGTGAAGEIGDLGAATYPSAFFVIPDEARSAEIGNLSAAEGYNWTDAPSSSPSILRTARPLTVRIKIPALAGRMARSSGMTDDDGAKCVVCGRRWAAGVVGAGEKSGKINRKRL